jgi:hypothetical protein
MPKTKKDISIEIMDSFFSEFKTEEVTTILWKWYNINAECKLEDLSIHEKKQYVIFFQKIQNLVVAADLLCFHEN